MANNKIHRIPPYFVQFQELRLFKIEQNPLEWPPRDVVGLPPQSDNQESSKAWIQGIQKWMQTHTQHTGERKHSDDSIRTDASLTDTNSDSVSYAHLRLRSP